MHWTFTGLLVAASGATAVYTLWLVRRLFTTAPAPAGDAPTGDAPTGDTVAATPEEAVAASPRADGGAPHRGGAPTERGEGA